MGITAFFIDNKFEVVEYSEKVLGNMHIFGYPSMDENSFNMHSQEIQTKLKEKIIAFKNGIITTVSDKKFIAYSTNSQPSP